MFFFLSGGLRDVRIFLLQLRGLGFLLWGRQGQGVVVEGMILILKKNSYGKISRAT
jgi:hypothetical protein